MTRIASLLPGRPLVLLATLVLAFGSTTAFGQRGGEDRGGWRGRGGMGGMGGFGRLMQPDFVRRDLTIIGRELQLDDDQSTIVEALLLDYQASFEDGLDEMRSQFTEMRPQSPEDQARREQRGELIRSLRQMREEFQAERERAGDDEAANEALREKIRARIEPIREQLQELRGERPSGEQMAEMREQMADLGREWRSRRDALRAEFLTSLQTVLAEEQGELWPPFDRTMRREKTLRDGRLSGERIDLFHLLNEMRLGEESTAALEGILEAYAAALDVALVQRNEFLETSREALWAAFGSDDDNQAIAIMNQESRLRAAVRDTNERYADLLAHEMEASVGPDPAGELRRSYREQAYGRVYRPTRMQRAFMIARELEELDEDVLGAVLGLEETYLVDLELRNAQIIEIVRREEPQESERRMRRRQLRRDGVEGDSVDDPIRDAYQARDELDTRYRGQLEQMLTSEQVEQLPPTREADAERRRQGDFGQFFRGDRGGRDRGGDGQGRGRRGARDRDGGAEDN